MQWIRYLVLSTALLTALVAGAQPQSLQPGLWEFTTRMSGAGASETNAAMQKMQKEMAAMPPEQRKMMQDMMAKQGLQMGTAGGGAMTMKVCLTQELLDRNELASGQRGDCKNTWSPRSGNTMKFSFTCNNPPGNGEGEVTFISRESYTSRMSVTTSASGKPEKMDINGSGKLLGKDCGTLKPLAVPK